MATYLLAWNPKRWIWEDLAEMALDVKEGQFVTTRWSCGNSKRMKQGNRVFLIRLGEEPKGIIASGEVLTDAYEDIHWAEEKRRLGKPELTFKFILTRYLILKPMLSCRVTC